MCANYSGIFTSDFKEITAPDLDELYEAAEESEEISYSKAALEYERLLNASVAENDSDMALEALDMIVSAYILDKNQALQ